MNASKNLFFVLFIVLSSTMHVYSAQNYCLQFDGLDDYVDMPDGFADFRNGFTIEMWAHPTSPRSYARFIDFGNGSPSDNIIFARNATSDTLLFEVYIGDSSGGRLEAGQVIDLNMWQHLAATLDLSGEVIIYKNGVEVARGAAIVPNNLIRANNYIAKSNWSWDEYYQGYMDEIRIWNRALTTEEIKTYMLVQPTGSEPNMVGYWKLDEGSGTMANDASGNGNNGTLYNDPCWASSDLMNSIQPDLQIRTDDESTYTGDNIYNDLLAQTKTQISGPNTTNIYDIRLQNDRVAVDRFIVTGPAGGAYWDVNFYEVSSGNDVTDEITGSGWITPILAGGGSLDLRLEVTPKSGVPNGNILHELVTATSISNANKSDAVKAATTFSATIPPPPWGATYTTNADFDKGTLVGVEHEMVPDQLQLSVESTTLPFIWVPNSNEGTVSKVDTRTGRELGRYRTGPSTNGDPSRTTVDLYGNCWVGNRNTGTVVKMGLLENGQYMDRNYNGIIETSRDLNGDGDITGNEILSWASDECVIYEVVLIPGSEGTYIPGQYQGSYANDYWNPGPRGIAVDAYNNIWGGCYGSKKLYYIDGSTGQILKVIDVSSVNHTSYGAVVDEDGILWSSGQDKNHVLRLNPTNDSFVTIALPHHVYGLGLDRSGHLFVSGWQNSKLSRINVSTTTVDWTKDGVYESRGVACTDDGDVWTANSGPGTVTRWTNDGIVKATIPVGNQPTGVAVDAEGKVWVVDNGDEYIHRVDPDTNTVDLSKRIIGTTHYGYSDMTGIVSRTATTRIGTWSVIHNTKQFNSPWGVVSWTSSEPAGMFLKVRVRSSNDRQRWSLWEDVMNYKALRITPEGRYLQVMATLQSMEEEASPILYDLTVNPSPCCGDLEHPYPMSDVNKDCRVDFFDFAIVAAEWLEDTGP
jgi:streptogramin lyase